MLRYRLLICLLFVFATACVPATSDTIEPQTAASAAASETAHEAEDEHGEDEPNNKDADEHGQEEGDHSDEDENERREHGAHEHGAAALMIAWSGNEMAIDLQTPTYNVLGFEYAPTSDEEKALLMESVAALEEGGLLQLSPDAECTLVSASVQTEFTKEGHDSDEEGHDKEGHDEEGHDSDEEGHGEEGHDEESHDEETHSDIAISYNLECQQPDNIASLDASELFAQFPNFEDIQVQWISDTQQSAADLTPDTPVLSFK